MYDCREQQHKATCVTCPVTLALPYLKYTLKFTGVVSAFSSSSYVHGSITLQYANKELFPAHYFQMCSSSIISEVNYSTHSST